MAQSGTLDRIIGAMFLNIDTYEEVERDSSLTGEAAVIVFLHAIAAALGSAGIFGLFGGVRAGIGALLGWLVWAAITYMIGVWFMGGKATWGELLRTLGYAHAPGLLLIIGILPLIGWIIYPVVFVWMLATGLIAIRQALDVDTGKALLTAFLGLVLLAVLRAVF